LDLTFSSFFMQLDGWGIGYETGIRQKQRNKVQWSRRSPQAIANKSISDIDPLTNTILKVLGTYNLVDN